MTTVASAVALAHCMVCDRVLISDELAGCVDVRSICPASSNTHHSYLYQVRESIAPAEYPDHLLVSGELVCSRCAALVNDIVIYQSRLADMSRELIAMVTSTLHARGASTAANSKLAGEQQKLRRPRKMRPRKSVKNEVIIELMSTRPRRTCKKENYLQEEDDDDPSPAQDDPEYAPLQSVVENTGEAPDNESDPESMQHEDVSVAEQDRLSTDAASAPDQQPTRRRRRRCDPSARHDCHLCRKRLASERSLQRHLLLHADEQRHRCATCGKQCADGRALRRHMVDHTGVRPYCCATCGKTLLSANALKIHQRNHLGIKTDSCSVCQKTFSSAQVLREHMRIHTGERPYTCQHCGRSFRTGKIFDAHVRTHTGARPHVCGVCGRGFSQRTPLTAHMRTGHTAEERAACAQERIGHTAVRTAAGIVDVASGQLMAPAAAADEADGSRRLATSATAAAEADVSGSVKTDPDVKPVGESPYPGAEKGAGDSRVLGDRANSSSDPKARVQSSRPESRESGAAGSEAGAAACFMEVVPDLPAIVG